jgi:Icc-related predicted phosphoesterase
MTHSSSLHRSKSHVKKQVSKRKALASDSTAGEKYYFGEPKYVPGEVNFKDPNSDEFRYKQPGFKTLVQRIPDPRVSPPQINLQDIIGGDLVSEIENVGRIVFHSVGDTGAKFSTAGLEHEAAVTEKMAEDFNEPDPADTPSFLFHLGDVIYNFGENEYYYDQFYEPFRNYNAPIFAIPGNHDGLIYEDDQEASLAAFWKHFCDDQTRHSPEAGGLARTTMTQPGVYFTLTSPLVTIIGLYSNTLEDPGIISSEGGKYNIEDKQKDFLKSELKRLHNENYKGAVILAVHHPPYTAGVIHFGSSGMLQDIDDAIKYAGNFAPHVVLSGHAHNYQRFTRLMGKQQIPFIVAGSGGHNALPIRSDNGNVPIRTPITDGDITFERYFADYGYLRVVVTTKVMSIEFHDVSSGLDSKSPMDVCTVDLQERTLTTSTPALRSVPQRNKLVRLKKKALLL